MLAGCVDSSWPGMVCSCMPVLSVCDVPVEPSHLCQTGRMYSCHCMQKVMCMDCSISMEKFDVPNVCNLIEVECFVHKQSFLGNFSLFCESRKLGISKQRLCLSACHSHSRGKRVCAFESLCMYSLLLYMPELRPGHVE